MILLSMKAPGSPSSPLQIINLLSDFFTLVNSHFFPVGNPPPPRPRNPDCIISSQISFGSNIV